MMSYHLIVELVFFAFEVIFKFTDVWKEYYLLV